MDHKFLDAFKTVEYKHIQIECSPLTNDQEKEMINELQATGFVIDAKPFQSEDSCLLYTSPSPRDATLSRMPSSA